MNKEPPALSVIGVSKSFGGIRAVDNVSLDLYNGECRVIIGPNGAGKTTLFNLITGELPVDKGKILLFGEDVTTASIKRRLSLGLARTYQIVSLFNEMTVEDNLTIALQAKYTNIFNLFINRYKIQLRDKLLELAENFSLNVKQKVMELSYGEKRKLEIAMAFALNPKILMLDEPTAGLTLMERDVLKNLLLNLIKKNRISILLVEHDINFALAMASNVYVMNQGSIIFNGTPEELYKNTTVIQVYFGQSINHDG
ncbi:MAG: ATP-binding cassette domain-containing protein [Nitrososphaerota archaeon]